METYLVINFGLESYLVEVSKVLRVLNINPKKITKTPNKTDQYIGVIMDDGDTIPLIDIRPILSVKYNEEDFNENVDKFGMYIMVMSLNDTIYGIVIDNFDDFINLDKIDHMGKNFRPIVLGEKVFVSLDMEKVIKLVS